jgi:2-polyprenyl-6-methoxyphenol hydroxylase-like FAD-dependent oxidoreductase
MSKADVLVVGAGPTGLSLAIELRRHGVWPRVIDQSSGLVPGSRAVALHSRTLEIFESMGIAAEVVSAGHKIHGASVHAEGKRILHFSFDEIDSPFPYALDLPQNITEQILLRVLTESGVTVQRNSALTGLQQSADGVQAFIQQGSGFPERWEGQYVVGCDGAFSTVRHVSSIGTENGAAIETYVAAEVRLNSALADDEWYLFFTEEGVLACAPLTGGVWRIIGDQRIFPDSRAESVRAVVKAHLGEVSALDWIGTYGVQHRRAARYQMDRVFLAGDAAHVYSPAGGQGMNAGIQDVHNLAWKLALTVQGKAAPSVLDSYGPERESTARSVMGLTEQLSTVSNLRSPVSQKIRNRMLPFLAQFEIFQQRISRQVANAGLNYRNSPIVSQHGRWYSPGPEPGERALDATLADGSRLFDRLPGTKHAVLLFTAEHPSADSLRGFSNIARYMREGYPDDVRTILISRAGIDWDGEHIVDLSGTLHHRYGAGLPCAYVIRPDRYIGYRGLSTEPMPVLEYFGHLFESVAT